MRQPVLSSAAGDAPAVHAVVVGVGDYLVPALAGLDAAATSALAFADWLMDEHRPPGLGRGSIDILVSDSSGVPLRWRDHVLDPPTLDNLQQAVDALFDRVDGERRHMTVFYFCGHGVEIGGLRSLMLADVDPSSKTDPFRKAISLDNFVLGMGSSSPRQQLYVVDACRELPAGFGAWDTGVSPGDGLVRPNLTRSAKLGPRTHVVLEATSSTQKAWAGNRGAWFTDAMLSVMKGAASDNRYTDEYTVNTRDIADVIKLLVHEGYLDPPAGPQNPVRKGEGDLELHVPAAPVVPVLVTRTPPADNTGSRFLALQDGAEVAFHHCLDQRPWRSDLNLGRYVFQRDADVVETSVSVPRKRVELP